MGCCGTKEPPPRRPVAPVEPESQVKREKEQEKKEKRKRKEEEVTAAAEKAEMLQSVELGENLDVVVFPDKELPPRITGEGSAADILAGNSESALSRIFELICDCDWKLELCIPSLDIPALIDVLNAVLETGIQVRILVDTTSPIEDLQTDVRVWKKTANPLEHCFAILDDSTVVMGSYDWKAQSTVSNRSACVIIKARKVAERYLREFNRLWEEAGPQAESYVNNARSAVHRFDRVSNIYFFPDWGTSKSVKHDTGTSLLTKTFRRAQKTLKIALPTLQDDEFLSALKALDAAVTMVTRPTSLPPPPFTVHYLTDVSHCFVILDDKEVITGSFDWTTASAHTKLQNCISFTAQNVVDTYVKEFDEMCATAGGAQPAAEGVGESPEGAPEAP
eukprot:TRINITY_DN25655_c0_g1_i2.p1 TRINITY_DN25655_c0_g1~~TRINITY_DN25655_c0_g1_i2.p1  ORF type:complete len:412 (+),score=90.07 TRINITY_DN25655_c0_g1_i2:63-1238(+)